MPMPTRSLKMSDIPQNDDVIDEVVSTEPVTNDSVIESDTIAPVEGESEQQVDEVALAQEKANAAFNKQYGEKKQLERDNAAQAAQLKQFQDAERQRQAAQVGNIPPMPDAFDDDFDEKVKVRDDAIIAQANYNTQNQAFLQQEQLNQQQAAQAKAVKVQESMVNYSQKATELGIKQEELQAAGNTVAGYGLSDDLVMHILADSDGPLITKHLAANPQDGYQLASMSPFNVGSFLDGIKQKASALKPKTSSTPNPTKDISGKGVTPSDGYKNLGGAKFE